MDIINENIPYENEKIHLILDSSLLNKSNGIIYSSKKENFLLINNYFLEYSSIIIDNNPHNKNISSIIVNNLLNKNDSTLIILTDSNNDSNEYLNTLRNLFNENNYKEYNINSILYLYNYINKKNKKYETYKISDIPNIEDNNLFIKIKIEFNNDIIYNCFKILIINNSYESICPFFCLNRKDYELFLLKEKINKLLSEEKIIEEKIKKLPLLNIDFIEDINSFKKETFDYFNKFINNIEKIKNYFNNSKSLTKNDINNFIKELNCFYDKINKENYKNKQNNIYREYIQVYNNINNICISNKNEAYLKSLFINFNNLNEEIVNFLENNDLNNKEITNLKNIIKFLQNELKQEKSKNISKIINNNDKNNFYNISIDNNNAFLTNNKSMSKINNSKKKLLNQSINLNKSLSIRKYNRNLKGNITMDNSTIIPNKSFEDNRHNKNDLKYLNKKINQLNEIIANFKSNNEIMEKSNEKMKKDINNLNKIISKLQREKHGNHLIPKSSSIKNIKPKIFEFKEKKEFPKGKRLIQNKNLYLNNRNNDNLSSRNDKNNNKNYINTSLVDDKHYEILKKIYEENKNMSKIINNYYFNNSELNLTQNDFNIHNNKTKNNSFINNSTSKKVKKKKIYYNNLKLNLNTDKKVNKNSSAPKIKILKTNYHK